MMKKNFIIEGIREGILEKSEELFADGYDAASNICVSVIENKTNTLLKRIDNGEYLSKEEQVLLFQLKALRKEVEQKLREYLENWTWDLFHRFFSSIVGSVIGRKMSNTIIINSPITNYLCVPKLKWALYLLNVWCSFVDRIS